MTKTSGQFAIIEHIKNFVKNTGRPWRKRDEHAISEDVARRLQKKSYERSLAPKDTSKTPPYLEIAKQLQVNNEQIFCAAVFNLAEIALNVERHKSAIYKLLQETQKTPNLTATQIKYLNTALQKLK